MVIGKGEYGYATMVRRGEVLVSEGFWRHFRSDGEKGAQLITS